MTEGPPTFKMVMIRGSFFCKPYGRAIEQTLTPGEPVMLEREPNNIADMFAIKTLCCTTGTHFGYIGREWACEIAPWMDRGWFFDTRVTDVEACPVHKVHVFLKLTPIRPAGKTQVVQQEKELEDV